MKTYLLTFFSLFIALQCAAQDSKRLVVEKVQGTVHYQAGKSRSLLKQGERLSNRDVLILPQNTSVILLAPKANKRYTLEGPYTGNTKNYVKKNERNCVMSVTSKYMNYLLRKAIQAHGNDKGATEDDHATVFRKGNDMLDDTDSIPTTETDSLHQKNDSIPATRPDSIAVEE